jgi:hypothetical protein
LADNPFLPLSFIAGPAILTNACTVMLNGASIRYNLAIGLWRDLQSDLHGHTTAIGSHYTNPPLALELAQRRVQLIVRGLILLYGAVGGFAFSTLTGLVGAFTAGGESARVVNLAKIATLSAGVVGLLFVLAAAVTFVSESRVTFRLLKLGAPVGPTQA